MLSFFRKYQKFFFIIVTTVIVVSFVFFGTYQAFMPSRSGNDEVVFKTFDGKKVKKIYFANFCRFLQEEGKIFGGGNFLNDGVISKDFFSSKLGSLVFDRYKENFKIDLENKKGRETTFIPYSHPEISFVSAEGAWTLFAPAIKENLLKLKLIPKGDTKELFDTKVALYLTETRFPGEYLAHILRYQEKEYGAKEPDHRLMRESLSLFGYNDLKDWFGEAYIEKVATIILNGAAEAKKEGLIVSRDEVLYDLVYKTEVAFQTLKENLPESIPNANSLFRVYLRERGLDENTLVDMWQDILLFRRLMQAKGSVAYLDTLSMKEFYSFVNEQVIIEKLEIPEEFQFKNSDSLKKFELYLDLVCKKGRDLLAIPQETASLEEIEKRAPELLEEKLVIEVGSVRKKDLQAKVSVKESWEWEEKNAALIKEKFPQAHDLESLDPKSRKAVDEFARAQIVEGNVKLLDEALASAPLEEKEFLFKLSLPGIKDVKALKTALNEHAEIASFTQDHEHYYHIKLKEKKPKQLLTFKETLSEGLLQDVSQVEEKTQKVLAALHLELRKQELLKQDIETDKLQEIACYRFVPFLADQGQTTTAFAKQFACVKSEEVISRAKGGTVCLDDLLKVSDQGFSKVILGQKGKAFIYRVIDRKADTTIPLLKMLEAQKMLSEEASLHFAKDFLNTIDKNV